MDGKSKITDYAASATDMMAFIEASPDCFHAVENLGIMLRDKGYERLSEKEPFSLQAGGKYYVTRNDSSLIAFALPKGTAKGYHITAAHSDSPCFKIKENPEIVMEDHYTKLNVEKYGGMIDSTWLDRPLSVAGRLIISKGGTLCSRLVNVDRDLFVIPNLAIHMNRDLNKGYEYNAQTDLLPLFAGGQKGEFTELLAKAAEVEPEQIKGSDLFLYVREKGRFLGANEEFVHSPRLDDLQCAYSCVRAMGESEPAEYINICAVFDNEEVGSGTKQGADSTFLYDILTRIEESMGDTAFRMRLANSFLISADNAHAVHPNHPEKADPTNRPYPNEGIVIKFHGGQKYTTDGVSAARFREICERAGVPHQTYHNRSDVAGGSTLGNISTAHVSIDTVDIGLAQLAMHSACETAGVKDTEYLLQALKTFYSE